MISRVLLVLVIIFSGFYSNAEIGNPSVVVHLLDYLANDYAGAVQNGKVVSPGEYAEQVEFANIVVKNSRETESLKSNLEFMTAIMALQNAINSKASETEVATKARKLQQEAIRIAGIEVSPKENPDLEVGSKIYQTSCVACHGQSGRGDGAAGVNLDPKPANFHNPDRVINSSPYKFYNTIRHGVPGTGMIAFPGLTDREVWSVAFYLKSLSAIESNSHSAPAKFSLKEISTLSDAELIEKLGGDRDQARLAVSSLRAIGSVNTSISPLETAERFLSLSLESARANDFSKANEYALRAYLEGVEPLEPKMKANLPGFVEKIETLMSQYRSALSNKDPIGKIESKKIEISGNLKEVNKLFSESKMSSSVAFGAAFSIFLREGFEAVLIIIILLSILRAMGQSEAIKWVHLGWISAISFGIITWFASGILLAMSGLSRELMEGSISLLAVFVLIYVGFWLHRYSEMKKWRAFLESKLKLGLSKGNYLALAVVAFMAVFREAFEVVLFLRAIWIDLDSSGQIFASSGVLSSILLLILLSYFAVKESKKIPLQKLFQVCSWTMTILAIILIGKGIHSLQEAGIVGINSISIPIRVDLLGIYPSIQTLAAQLALVILFTFLYYKDRQTAIR